MNNYSPRKTASPRAEITGSIRHGTWPVFLPPARLERTITLLRNKPPVQLLPIDRVPHTVLRWRQRHDTPCSVMVPAVGHRP